jgi:hypothetical protein
MGEFSANLLKLTEFPFSYSLIGLLALIFGEGINLEELSFAKIGPILILIGFMATTLSVCDPVGAFQRLIIKGRKLPYTKIVKGSSYLDETIFGKRISPDIFPPPYLFAIAYSPDGMKKRYEIDWALVEQFFSESREFSRKRSTRTEFSKLLKDSRREIGHGRTKLWLQALFIGPILLGAAIEYFYKVYIQRNSYEVLKELEWDKELRKKGSDFIKLLEGFKEQLNTISKSDIEDLGELGEGLKQRSVKTKWITAEVDRITAEIWIRTQ